MNSIIVKFIAVFGTIFLTILVSIFYFLLNDTENTLKKQISEDLTVLAETQEGYVLLFLEHAKSRVTDFSSDGLVRNYTEEIINSEKSFKGTSNAFSAHLKNNKQNIDKTIKGILVFDLDGTVIAASDEEEVGEEEAGEFYFEEMKNMNLDYGNVYMSKIFVSYHFGTSDPVFFVGAPIFSVDKKTKLGYLVNQISLDEISKILNGTRQIELGALSGIRGRRMSLDIYLVDKDGLLLTPSIYKNNEGLLKQKISTPLTVACRDENKELTEIYNNYFGMESLGASMCLPIHNWTLITEISTEEAFSAISNLRKDVLTSLLITLLILAVSAGLFLYRFIIRNILALRKGAQIIGAGNLDYEIKIKSKDEIGNLAQDFNNMARRLKILFDGLELSSVKVKESEEKYRTMFDGAADAILIADVEGNFLEANEKAMKITGYAQDEILKMNHSQLYERQDLARCLEEFKSVLIRKGCFIENVSIIKKSKELLPVDVGISMFEYGANQRLQFLFHDISERVAIEKHHKEIDHLKSQFINVVSHQLRTPLNSIRWNLEVLLSGDLGKFKNDQEKFLKMVYLNNQNIMSIISDLFLALEIEESTITLEKEIVDIEMMVNSIMDGFKNELKIKKLKLKFEKPKGKHFISIEADRNKLIQVLDRLIDNAIKYSKEDGEIVVGIDIVKNRAVISIKDNGVGIPKDEQVNVFSKFFRASNAAIMQQNASGLGLFISKKIVEAHKGSIWFESAENKGTTFYIGIPMAGQILTKS